MNVVADEILESIEAETKGVGRMSASEDELGNASRWRWFMGIAF